jgi:hypothetical protein
LEFSPELRRLEYVPDGGRWIIPVSERNKRDEFGDEFGDEFES